MNLPNQQTTIYLSVLNDFFEWSMLIGIKHCIWSLQLTFFRSHLAYTSSILNFSYHRFLSPLEPCPQGSFSPMISNLSIQLFPKAYSSLMQSYPCFINHSFTTLFGAWQRSVLCSIIIAINSNHTNNWNQFLIKLKILTGLCFH